MIKEDISFDDEDLSITEEQFASIKNSANESISITTGGAGTGKTTILTKLAETLIKYNNKPMYLAYVGAAVQRIKETFERSSMDLIDEIEIMTIHLAIAKYSSLKDSGITHVIFDECSMIDMELLYDFMDKFSDLTNLRYVFVGDINQLEPISTGNVMGQLLKTSIGISYLTRNFRSERGILDVINQIVDETRIKENETIMWEEFDYPDFLFLTGGEEELFRYLQHLDNKLQRQKPRTKKDVTRFLDNITIVTFFRDTCSKVNSFIQRTFLEGFDFIQIERSIFYERDRVMNLKNNYFINVMNGEIGRIIELNSEYIGVVFREGKISRRICEDGETEQTPLEIKSVYLSVPKYKLMKKLMSDLKIAYDCTGKSDKTINEEVTILANNFKKMKNGEYESQDIESLFDIIKKYPKAIFNNKLLRGMKIKHIVPAYCVTVRKAQGNQYNNCICYHDSRTYYFLNRRVLYTELSRAKNHLTLICQNEDSINKILLNREIYTYENLHININNRLPPELRKIVEEKCDNECYDLDVGSFDDDYGDIDLDDLM